LHLTGVQVPGTHWFLNPYVKRTGDKHFMPPFWLIRRSTDQAAANSHLKECTLDAIQSMSLGGAPQRGNMGTQVKNDVLPIMTNEASVKQGEELVLFALQEQKETTTKGMTWTQTAQVKRQKLP